MSKHLERDIHLLHQKLMNLFGIVEKMIDKAVRALCEKRIELAKEVIAADLLVNSTEVEIEEDCLKILALHQPFAGDLRRIATVMKINVELERMADLSCNIAERAECMHQHPFFPMPEELPSMVNEAKKMIRVALDSFVESDADLARHVISLDAEVDRYNLEIISELKSLMRQDPSLVEPALHCFSASRHIERVADLAENIAEDVIYLVDGDIVRHQHNDFDRMRETGNA